MEEINVSVLAKALILTGIYVDEADGFPLPRPRELAKQILTELDELDAWWNGETDVR
jgi:hypothetical protein